MRFITKTSLLLGAVNCAKKDQTDILTGTGSIIGLQSKGIVKATGVLTGRLTCTSNGYHDGEEIKLTPFAGTFTYGSGLTDLGITMLQDLVNRRCLSTNARKRLDELVLTNAEGVPAMYNEWEVQIFYAAFEMDSSKKHLVYRPYTYPSNLFQPLTTGSSPSEYFEKLDIVDSSKLFVPLRDGFLADRGFLIFVPLSRVIQSATDGRSPVSYSRDPIKDEKKFKKSIEPAKLVRISKI